MAKIIVKCSWCESDIERYQSQLKLNKNNYCSRACRSKHLSKEYNPDGYRKHEHLSEYNRENNKYRMDFATRVKLRKAKLGTGHNKGYKKVFGVHEHRIIAARKLGRPLLPNEVVHHIDRDKRNNKMENLMVFSSQSEHAKWHANNDIKVGDDL